MRGPFPDLHMHRAISIFQIQFAGATSTSRYPKRNFRNSAWSSASWPCLACQVVFERKGLLGKWSAIAMLELQRIRFAGWELTEGQQAISKFSLQVLQPLPGIQKGIFEIQLAGNSACRLTVERSFPRSPYA